MNDLITLPRATVQQALEALDTPIHEQPFGLKQAAITALKAALAQQAEPVAWGFGNTAITGSNRWMMLCEKVPPDDQYGGAMWTPLYTAPPAAQQAEQTIPLAELQAALGWPGGISSPVSDKAELLRMVAAKQKAMHPEIKKLFEEFFDKHFAETQRKPLTDEEALALIDNVLEGGSTLDIVRAVERAHGITEADLESPERRCGGPGCDGTCCKPVDEPENPSF